MEAPRLRPSRAIVEIAGMKTVHCVRAVFQALAGVPGITRADVQLGRADIDIEGSLREEWLASALEVIGYRLVSMRSTPRELPLWGDE